MRSLILSVLAAVSVCAGAADDAALRDSFRAAYAAAQAGATRSDNEDALRGYVLYPYIESARLRALLDRTPAEADAAIAEFLRTRPDQPAATRLRKPWLLSLAERKSWKAYLDALPPDTADAALRCHALVARIALKRSEHLLDGVLSAWLTGQDQPDACDLAFEWLRAQGALTDSLIRQRATLALQADQPRLARRLAERLPPGQSAKALLEAARLLDNPVAEFKTRLRDGLPDDTNITLAAFNRLARRDSKQALALLGPLALQLSPEQRSRIQGDAAVGLALDHDAEALPLFRTLDVHAHPAAQEWRLRSALWAGEWQQALTWIAQMSGAAQQEPRWRYWRGRALSALGRDTEARIAYTEAAQDRSYYGFLAAERLGVAPRIESQPLPVNEPVRQMLDRTPAFVRARELYLCGLETEAGVEFRQAIAGLDTAGQTEAAREAAEWGWYHQTIPLLASIEVWDDVALRYPLPFAAEVEAASRESGVPLVQIYAVMRQESLFNPGARSPADAYGLLQLLPGTARRTAARFGLDRPTARSLQDATTNLRIGALHLKELLEKFRYHWPLALAAYNAGPNRIPGWLPPQTLPADIWIENIPFNETRLYVQRILGHRVLFGWRLEGKPLPMLPLMDDIPAAIEGLSASSAEPVQPPLAPDSADSP